MIEAHGRLASTPRTRPRARVAGRAALALVAFAVTCLFARASSADAPLATRPPPAWVAPVGVDFEEAPSTESTPNGRRVLLYDTQVRVDRAAQESYSRLVVRVTNESGLQPTAQIRIGFDPTCEALVLHAVTVRRGDRTFDRLDPAAIKVVQREPNLEQQVYDGRKEALLFLEDLRVGDVVEYAFTRRGADPTLGGRYADAALLGASEPVHHLRARVLVPRGRRVHVAIHTVGGDDDPALHPAERELGAEHEYLWDLRDTKGAHVEPETPSWVDAVPWAQLSEFDTWADVAAWGAKAFARPGGTSPELRAWVERARAETKSRDELALRAIRFVQDEIRYVGIEAGLGRTQPTDPSRVLARRFGDCKDKALLLATLLRLGGISASPALVSTTHGFTLARWAPSPNAFDHAIVRVALDGDAPLWVDPTASLQGGGLARYAYAPWDVALVLDGAATTLERVAREPTGDVFSPRILDRFTVAPPGAAEPTRLDSERVYEGAFADAARAAFRRETIDETAKSCLRAYEKDFPSIREAAPLERVDDRDQNVVRVVAHFVIPSFWKPQGDAAVEKVELPARPFEGVVDAPAILSRTVPLAVPFPLRTSYTMRLALPFDLAITPQTQAIASPALSFEFASTYRDRQLAYTYDVTTHARAVDPSELDQHARALARAKATLAHALTYRVPAPPGPQWIVALVLAACVAAASFGAVRAYRYVPKTRWAGGAPDLRYAGIGGWLYLLGLNVLVAPLLYAYHLVRGAERVVSNTTFHALAAAADGRFSAARAVLLVLEVAASGVFLAYGVVVAISFLRRKRGFPFHLIAMAVGHAVWLLVDAVAAALLSNGSLSDTSDATIVRAWMFAIVWGLYVARSRRVAATFDR